jgi:hypothetical protein
MLDPPEQLIDCASTDAFSMNFDRRNRWLQIHEVRPFIITRNDTYIDSDAQAAL